jgi:hypothetical protein
LSASVYYFLIQRQTRSSRFSARIKRRSFYFRVSPIATDEPEEEREVEAPYDPKPHAVYYGPSPELLKQTGNTTKISKKNLK